ncbi:hypothetical protein G6F50_009299 [Rhizopus delemar]|uniref:Ser-Thr-rich glycosyl-phosphatidyl-inositol-anchored membrane family-domain-containing protein n=1 Tax=Rhizopus delemar TaxID=936053 RepID=A0A9P6YY74_9FUNG|nr:hypothetical protein G6F50_009299 [Rhizopus delemar]
MLIRLFQFLIFSFVVSPTYSFRIQWTVPSLDISAGSSAFLTWVDYNISLPITVKLAVQNPDGNLAVVYTWDSINPSLSMYFVELPLTTQPGINYYFIAYQVPSDYGTLGPFTVKSSLGQIPYTSVIVNVGATPTSSAVAVSASNPYTSRTISGFTRSSAQPTPTHGTSDLSSTGAQSSLSTGAIAGISVGATVGVIIGLLSFFIF